MNVKFFWLVRRLIKWLTFKISLHSSSNLSITADRFWAGFPISFALDGFLNTSKRFRFFNLDLSSRAWRSCCWSRVELEPPCKIDLTAWTSRFRVDSFTLFFSEINTKNAINDLAEPKTHENTHKTSSTESVKGQLTYLFAVEGSSLAFHDSILSINYRIEHYHKSHSHFYTLNRDQFAVRMLVLNTFW